MSWPLIALAMLLALVPVAGASQQANSTKRQMTFHGCVMPGVDRGTYVMTDVMQLPGSSGATMPEVAHGRRVLFWLHNDDDVKKHIGHMVEVRGEFRDLEKSEIELKAGPQKQGGLIVEFEGPGKDVRASHDAAGAAVGTAGRTVPERNDVPTYLAHINVENVKVVGECN
jgi:hypothetical protein